jgi:hypothetical protein
MFHAADNQNRVVVVHRVAIHCYWPNGLRRGEKRSVRYVFSYKTTLGSNATNCQSAPRARLSTDSVGKVVEMSAMKTYHRE